MSSRRAATAVAAALIAILALAGCAPTPGQTVTPTLPLASPGGGPVGPSPSTDPDEHSGPLGEPTCDGIISSVTVADLTKLGWQAREDPFYVGNIELPGGIQCTWGDPEVASDQVQVFGWAPLDSSLQDEVKKELLDSGWKEFEDDGITYVTATGDMVMNPDDEGYGITYRIEDGQIAVADTKQGLLLVQWPPQ